MLLINEPRFSLSYLFCLKDDRIEIEVSMEIMLLFDDDQSLALIQFISTNTNHSHG